MKINSEVPSSILKCLAVVLKEVQVTGQVRDMPHQNVGCRCKKLIIIRLWVNNSRDKVIIRMVKNFLPHLHLVNRQL